ncbi:MAG TPA: molybdate ABC transporter substrate-binding protein [Glaciecola sp.]|nr:molybdate ABC transporter substrate-binding protein [Glaciecola sp.]
MRKKLTLVMGLLMLCACTPAEQIQDTSITPAKLRVAVASNFYPTLSTLLTQHTLLNEQITLIHGSTGTLYAQITHGAPFDVFLAADEHSVSALMDAQLLEYSVNYAQGELVLWPVEKAAQTNPISNTLIEIRRTTNNKIAIADPQLAPYGLAAQQTLVALGIYEQMSAQLVIGNNVNQAFQFVNTHNAVIGLLAKSQLIAAAGQHTDDAQRYQQFVAIPAHLHQPIIQQAGILTRTQQLSLAQYFMAWLMSDTIQQQLPAHGYISGKRTP